MKFFLSILSVIGSVLIFTSCSDDDDNSSTGPTGGGTGGHGGSASFDVSGDVEASHSGIADFRAFEMNGIYTWDINMLDNSPITFNLSFVQTGFEPIEQPGPGTYELGFGSTGDYSASYAVYEDDNPFGGEDYLVGFGETSGELVITTSTDELIEGTFSFSAARLDDDGMVDGTVTVTNGEFSAVPRP